MATHPAVSAVKAANGPDFDPEVRDQVLKLTRSIIAGETRRADINAAINADRKAIKALGVDLDAWRASKRRLEMDPDVRKDFDRSQLICNNALGVPVQADLFGDNPEEVGGIPATLN